MHSYKAKDKAGFTELVNAEQVLSHTILPDDIDQTMIPSYILTARRYVETECNVPLVTKTVTVQYETFPEGKLKMILPLITEEATITGISYVDADNVTQTIDASEVILANVPNPNYIFPKEVWPTGAKNVVITYEATAYYDKDTYVAPVCVMVAHMAMNRDITDTKFQNSLSNMLAPLKKSYHT